jgi:myo-inositol-1(or 4)-monophosphatase
VPSPDPSDASEQRVTGATGTGGIPRQLIRELAGLGEVVAREAGDLVRRGLDHARRVTATKSSATDVVTEVDQAVERHVVGRILAARPHDAVLGEEGGGRSGRSGVRWLVDPIDGTVNYLYGHPGFSVSIAAEVSGTVVAGTVLEPWRDELFSATLGGGATLNGLPIRANPPVAAAQALVATGFSYRPEQRARQARVLLHVLPRVRDIRRVGSAALDLCDVAAGRVDAYYEVGLNPWDLAAGGLIAAEAGATVTDLAGRRPADRDRGVLAAPGDLHPALVELLREAGGPAADTLPGSSPAPA